ncbi:MAG: DEAD/DEAH box helicase [Clostridiaceae bacterium]|jgi:ATP-dependent DNA helicase RecG|nr:DEAD/DEAH box helicase [Clostridiaceae bacterium]
MPLLLENLKGVGPATLAKLSKLGITDINGLLNFLPKAYVDLKSPGSLDGVSLGDFVFLKATVKGVPHVKRIKRLTVLTFDAECVGKRLKVIYFNQPYFSNKLADGVEYCFLGKATIVGGTVELINPVFECADALKRLKGVYTVYPLRGILGQSVFKGIMLEAVKVYDGGLADDALSMVGLPKLKESYALAHFPNTVDEVEAAHRGLAVRATAGFITAFRLSKGEAEGRAFFYNFLDDMRGKFIAASGFTLTPSQEAAIDDIVRDLSGDTYMNRILAGDVGSGKTVIAFFAAYAAAVAGGQAALMAPTEILARQHYAKAYPLFKQFGFETALLTASQSASERRLTLALLRSGAVDFAVGTHALFQEDVEFKSLALAIADEQHRFGVAEKRALEGKGGAVDTLVLSATPIPRALTLILYDDLGLSKLEARLSRSDVTTRIVPDSKLDGMFKFIADGARCGAQAFIVCPRISDSEGMDLYSAETLYKEAKSGVFKGINVGLLHGRMSAQEKAEIMESFACGEIKVLVATTVVEVGIDVKGATSIAVLNAERFGLASLHQLRGRVGRGGGEAFCFLHTKNPSAETLARLQVLKNNNDGFTIAELDFDLRGGGDFLGLNQSGDGDTGRYSVCITREIVSVAKVAADKLMNDKAALKLFIASAEYAGYADRMKKISIS